MTLKYYLALLILLLQGTLSLIFYVSYCSFQEAQVRHETWHPLISRPGGISYQQSLLVHTLIKAVFSHVCSMYSLLFIIVCKIKMNSWPCVLCSSPLDGSLTAIKQIEGTLQSVLLCILLRKDYIFLAQLQLNTLGAAARWPQYK